MSQFKLRKLGVAHDASATRPRLQDCIEAVLEHAPNLMDDVLEGLRLALLPGHEKSQPALQTPLARATIDRWVADRGELASTFAAALRGYVYSGDQDRRGLQGLVRFDDFQMLAEDQIDANIEAAMTQQEVALAVESVLPALNGFVSALLGWSTVQPHLNPLKPEVFAVALRDALKDRLPEDAARAALMSAAAGVLGSALKVLYKEIIGWLRTQGVDPVAPAGSAAAAQATENPVARTLLTLDKLRQLLSGDLSPGTEAPVRDFTHTVPASLEALEDLKLVEPMMRRLTQRAKENQTAAAAGFVQPAPREPLKRAHLGRQLGREVVRLMLDSLVQDQRLLPGVRDAFKQLEPALIRLSQEDPRFFSDRQHAARLYLDRVTSRSLAYTSEADPGFARFVKAIDNSVQVLVNGPGDAATFARMLRKLEELWTREDQERRARTEEAARSLLHAEQRNLLAQKLAQEFAQRQQGKEIPEMVQAFLRGPWAQAVAQAQLACSEGPTDAATLLSVVDDLLWSVQLRLVRRHRARLVELLPGLLLRMRQGLALIAYPEERMTAFFDELISYHEKAFDSARSTDEAGGLVQAAAAKVPSAGKDDEVWMAHSEAKDSGYYDIDPAVRPLDSDGDSEAPSEPATWSLDELATGSWVDLALGHDWVRAQLSWCSPHRTLFMFISGSGLSHSVSRKTLERMHSHGLIRLVSDGRLVDNALDGVAQAALRNDVDQAGRQRKS